MICKGVTLGTEDGYITIHEASVRDLSILTINSTHGTNVIALMDSELPRLIMILTEFVEMMGIMK